MDGGNKEMMIRTITDLWTLKNGPRPLNTEKLNRIRKKRGDDDDILTNFLSNPRATVLKKPTFHEKICQKTITTHE